MDTKLTDALIKRCISSRRCAAVYMEWMGVHSALLTDATSVRAPRGVAASRGGCIQSHAGHKMTKLAARVAQNERCKETLAMLKELVQTARYCLLNRPAPTLGT